MTVPLAARRRPAGRYDEPSKLPARALAVLLSVLFVGLVVAVVQALYERYSTDQVRARVIGFEVESDSRVRVDLEVSKPEGARAYCIVRSRGADGAEVGREVAPVDVSGSDQRVVRKVYVLTTRARGVTGEVGRCSPEPIPTTRPSP